jgi:hypothetical protein
MSASAFAALAFCGGIKPSLLSDASSIAGNCGDFLNKSEIYYEFARFEVQFLPFVQAGVACKKLF